MPRPARVVEHLRLRGESESAVRRALPALEDAFRTALLPDIGARLVCVRRLQLGQLPANGSAQSVSLLIEKRFTEDDVKIVHAGEDGASGAEAVWFRDGFQAHEAAALRIAAGQPLDAWFWPLALPAITAAASEGRLRAIAFAIAAAEEAPAALPAWTASLVRAGYRAQLIAALRPGDGRALLRSAGISAVSTVGRHEHAMSRDMRRNDTSERATTTAPAEPRRASDLGHWNAELDDRLVFVELMTSRTSGCPPQWPTAIVARSKATAGNAPAAVMQAPDVGTRPGREHGTPSSDARLESGVDHRNNPPSPEPDQTPGTTGDTDRGGAAVATPSATAGKDRRTASSPDADDVQVAAQSAASVRTTGDRSQTFASWFPDAAPTAAGGLLFVLPVLERVGFAKWAAERGPEEPAPDVLAAEIMRLLLSRLGVEQDDPVWRIATAFRLKPEATGELSGFRLQPETSRDLRGAQLQPEASSDLRGAQLQPEASSDLRGVRLQLKESSDLRGFRLQPEGCESATIWLTSCRRYLRRRARIGLASLVLRPARFAVTPTHVDVFFRLNAADLRIRRAGLDIDPGWVPWFGRVVAFHYGERSWN